MDANGAGRLKHDTTVTMRMPQQTKELIEKAAHLVSKSLSAFVIESASQHAIDVLLDQTLFNLSADQAEAFSEILDNPPAPLEKLKALMKTESRWER